MNLLDTNVSNNLRIYEPFESAQNSFEKLSTIWFVVICSFHSKIFQDYDRVFFNGKEAVFLLIIFSQTVYLQSNLFIASLYLSDKNI